MEAGRQGEGPPRRRAGRISPPSARPPAAWPGRPLRQRRRPHRPPGIHLQHKKGRDWSDTKSAKVAQKSVQDPGHGSQVRPRARPRGPRGQAASRSRGPRHRSVPQHRTAATGGRGPAGRCAAAERSSRQVQTCTVFKSQSRRNRGTSRKEHDRAFAMSLPRIFHHPPMQVGAKPRTENSRTRFLT